MSSSEVGVLVVGGAIFQDANLAAVLSSLPDFPCRVLTVSRVGDAIELLGDTPCDVVLVGWDSIEAMGRLAKAAPAAAILVIARADQENTALQSLTHGADGILFLDEIGGTRLRRAIRTALARRQSAPRHALPRLSPELISEIEKRQATEAALTESEQRFRDFVTASSDWIWEMGPDLRFTEFGGRLHEALGLDPSDLIGKTWADIATPGDNPEVFAAHMDNLRARRPFRDFQCRYGAPQARALYLRTSGKPVHSPDGVFMGYRGTATNSTAEVMAEHRAQSAQIQLYDAIESISEGFILHDAEGRLVLCNSKFKNMYSLIADSLTPGISFASIARLGVERGQYMDLGCGSQEYVRRRLKQRVSTGSVFVQHLLGDRWIQVSERRTGDGGTVSIRTDITALRKAEEELRAAKEDAERANRTKSDFLANMSHELRTPLNAIMGFAETMHLEIFGPLGGDRYREYINDIHVSASHLLGLINDLLDIAKIESGTSELFCEQLAPRPLLESCVQLMREEAETANLSLSVQFDEDLPNVVVDERRIKQVVLNLLANAIKFTPKGGSVIVATHGDDPENPLGGLVITVSDTGIGIAPEDIPTALTAFGQVHSTYTRTNVGTGLGLPLSRRLIEMHGGSLSLDSTVGKGTTVTIRLPPERVALSNAPR